MIILSPGNILANDRKVRFRKHEKCTVSKISTFEFFKSEAPNKEKCFSFINCNVKDVVVLYQKEDWTPVPQSKNSFWGAFLELDMNLILLSISDCVLVPNFMLLS